MSVLARGIVHCNFHENLLLTACDIGNYEQVKDLLESYQSQTTTLSPLVLSKAFHYTLIQHHLDLIRLFLLPKPIISQEDIDTAFTDQVHLGLHPEIIYLLQDYCSTRLLAELNRYQRKARFDCYLIQPSEMEQILLYQRLLMKKVKRTTGVLTPSSSQSTYLYLQLQINNLFFDAGFCNWRYLVMLMMQRVPLSHFPIVSSILSSSSSSASSSTSSNDKLTAQPSFTPEHNIQPPQTTINQVFSIVLKKGNFPLADIMCSPNPLNPQLVVSQEGIDDALRLCVRESNCPAIEWFYMNEGGVRPSQDVTETVYRDLLLYEQKLYRPESFDRWTMYRQFFPSQLRKVSRANIEKREEVQELITIVAMYVPQEVVTQVNEEMRHNEERERRMIQARHRLASHYHGSDIHSYSAAMIAGEGEGPIRMDDVGDGDSEDFDERFEENRGDDAMEVVAADRPQDPLIPAAAEHDHPPVERPVAAVAAPNNNNGNNSVHQRRTLNMAIYEHLKQRVGQDFSFHQDIVTTELTNLVQRYLPSDKQDEAYRRLGEMLNRESVENFGVTLAFLRMFHPSQMGVWITGFLGESIDVHSCTPGAMERIATGLRGIGDEGLDRIFSQAEGPQLFRIFLSTFNIFDARQGTKNRDRLIDILLEGRVHPLSTLEEVREVLNEYLIRMKEQFSIAPSSMKNDLESLVDVIIDVYETDVLPTLREKFLARQQEEQRPQTSRQASQQMEEEG